MVLFDQIAGHPTRVPWPVTAANVSGGKTTSRASENDAAAGQLLAYLLDRVQGGDIHLDVGLGVEDQPGDAFPLCVHGTQRTAC
jgi:hypothetical protein